MQRRTIAIVTGTLLALTPRPTMSQGQAQVPRSVQAPPQIVINGKVVARAAIFQGRPYLKVNDLARLINGAQRPEATLRIEGNCMTNKVCGVIAVSAGGCDTCAFRVSRSGVISRQVHEMCKGPRAEPPGFCPCCGVRLDDVAQAMGGKLVFDESTNTYTITSPARCSTCIIMTVRQADQTHSR
jgi:hypothetical protein